MQKNRLTDRTGAVAVALIVVLITVDLIIVGMVLSGGREHDLTVKRVETVQAFFAAEAGMNMSIKEMMEGTDYDTDGMIGTISDDSDDLTDPDIGNAKVFVFATTSTPKPGQTTLTSRGRAGDARRDMQSVIE